MRLALLSLAGLGLFLWPLLGGSPPGYLAALTVALAVLGALLLLELGMRRLDARGLALIAALAALDAGLRLAVVTGIGGFSPVFFLILCAGYVFGASFGFLTGALALLVSAVATGGIGPWLPYQLFAAGWVGVAGSLVRGRGLWPLALVGVATGFLFGALMDTWDWSTFYRGAAGFGWSPGLPVAEALSRFGRFYLATSLAYDGFRAVGNAVMVLVFGPPVVAALSRLRSRLAFQVLDPSTVPAELFRPGPAGP
jgi:energy-coupling factor transport system substrate-specific component